MRLSAWLTHWDVQRSGPRRPVLFQGDAEECRDAVLVTDISLAGARLLTPAPLEVGSKILLQLPMLEPLKATIVWVSNRIAGCAFARPLHPAHFRVIAAQLESEASRIDA